VNIFVRNAVAEMIGTFTLCFIGILAIKNLGEVPGGLIGIAFAHGLAIAVMIAALGHVSGGHFNPAVTIGLLLGRKISPALAAVHIVAQLLGGLLASLIVSATFSSDVVKGGTPTLASDVSTTSGIVLEMVATFFLVLVIYSTAVDARAPKSVYPFAIGLTITVGIMAIGPFTGAALNPARGFGPAIIGGEWGGAVAWTVGPILGAILAALVFLAITSKDVEEA
jgi:MIP family channel proteins